MIPGMNKKMMEKAMKQLGVKHEDIEADEVVIKQGDNNLVIKQPTVTKINMSGQETYQVTGEAEVVENINEDDVKTVMEQANVDREEAVKALKENNFDIAATILKLKE